MTGTNIKSEMRSFKSNENIHKKEGGSYYVVSANKASSPSIVIRGKRNSARIDRVFPI